MSALSTVSKSQTFTPNQHITVYFWLLVIVMEAISREFCVALLLELYADDLVEIAEIKDNLIKEE